MMSRIAFLSKHAANIRKTFEYTRNSLRNFIIKRKLQIQMNTLNYINPSRTVCARYAKSP